MKPASQNRGFVHLIPVLVIGGVLLVVVSLSLSSRSANPQSLGKWVKKPVKMNSVSPTSMPQIDPENITAIQAELDAVNFGQFDLDLKALSQENY